MTRPNAAWLPYLILPLGVALLEYHGIQFWTVAVTGAWPGWASWGFAAAWSAWGWPVLLEAGALWCWLRSRAEDPVAAAGWTFGGGLLTVVLCTAALWNVAAPVRQNLAVSQALSAEAEKAEARETVGQQLALRQQGVPYKRIMDNLLRSQAESVRLFRDQMDRLQSGQSDAAGQGRVVLWLQIACVVLGQLLVVASARAMGGTATAAADFTDNTDEKPKRHWMVGTATERGVTVEWTGPGPHRGSMAMDSDGIPRMWTGEKWSALNEETTEPAHESAERVHGAKATTGEALSRGAEGLDHAPDAGAGSGEAGEAGNVLLAGRSGFVAATPTGRDVQADILPPIARALAAKLAEAAAEPPEAAPEEPEAKEPVSHRVAAVLGAIQRRWPMLNQKERAVQLGISERDMSLLENHARLAAQKQVSRHVKIISENALAKVEAVLGIVATAAEAKPGTRVRSL